MALVIHVNLVFFNSTIIEVVTKGRKCEMVVSNARVD